MFYFTAWTIFAILQLHTIVCQSGRRSDKYQHISESNPKGISVRNKSITLGHKQHSPIISLSSNIINISDKTLKSAISEQSKNSSHSDIVKIKTLLPYVLIKRAYSKLKSGKGSGRNDNKTDSNPVNHKLQHNLSTNNFIDRLCSISGTSICGWVSQTKIQW